ncbi:hypothetical protein DPMN_083301 [Dreissena polymorpha]|uniref:Uncharacterized protein n=1 Tax=Dreissena polymorpha TaxID=45954 RepID=A0A9D4BJP3_DREPO|nr:hypothetical protein DPMN_083301 [Dreissena polymorpha]
MNCGCRFFGGCYKRLQEKTITVENNTIFVVGTIIFCSLYRSGGEDIQQQHGRKKTVLSHFFRYSPGLSRFANAGRPARTVPCAAPVEAGQQPGRVPVNPDLLRFIPVNPRLSPRPGIAPSPGRATVYRNTAGTHQLRQRPGFTPVVAGNAPAVLR